MLNAKTQLVVVDDNKDLTQILCSYLSNYEDFEIVGTANNGIEAIKIITEKEPDVVIMDIVMPLLDGLGVLEKINSINIKKRPQIIILSALGHEKTIQIALSLGAEFFMAKPFEINDLVSRIRQLKAAGLQQEIHHKNADISTLHVVKSEALTLHTSIKGEVTIQNKYDCFNYWKNLFDKCHGNFSSVFKRQPISIDSVFFHEVIISCHHKGGKNSWIYFPNLKAMLGFIKFIYLPTVFFMFLGDGDKIGCTDTDGMHLLELMSSYKGCMNKQMLPQMRLLLKNLDGIIDDENDTAFTKLKLFSNRIDECCNKKNDRFAYFNVFQTPKEVGEFILNCYKDDENIDINDFENQLGVGAEEWLNICENIYENEFMNRMFTDILNNRIGDMILKSATKL